MTNELQPLRLLRPADEAALLEFELANRAYFSRFITDRGDDFYEQFAEHVSAALTDQDLGECAYYVLASGDDQIVGRFNLYDIADGTARVGYRVAEQVAGRGVATAALHELVLLSTDKLGLITLTAETTDAHTSSQRVLEKAGFVSTGPTDVAGKPGTAYACRLARA